MCTEKTRSAFAFSIWLLSAASAVAAPNIVIFYADDMGIGDLGCYGCKDIRTPALDGLAAGGVRFTNYYSAAPICSPSRAALLTGRYPIRAGVPSNVSSQPGDAGMPGGQITLGELARTRGYATAAVGKWHLGFSPDTQPNAQGFDLFFGHHAGCIDFYSHMFYWQDPPHHDLYRNRDEVHEEGAYMTDLVVREAVRFIEAQRKANATTGFLLYVAFNAPHYPMQAPAMFRKMYEHLPPERAIYAAMVTAMDDAVARILAAARAAGRSDNTFVFFASDNGATAEMRANGKGGSNAPYRGHKFSLFDGGIHLPAIACWPGHIPAGESRDQLACGIDLFPTVAEIIGSDVPAGHRIDGRSLLPIARNAQAAGHDALYWKQGDQEAVRQGPWKLVINGLDTAEGGKNRRLAGDDALFLGDLRIDPGETRNVRAEYPETVRELQGLLAAWRKDLDSGG